MTFRRLLAIALFAVAIAGPIVEMFDRWDRTLQDGNDIEGTCVVIALCAGAAVTMAAARARAGSPLEVVERLVIATAPFRRTREFVGIVPFDSSPPVSLRI